MKSWESIVLLFSVALHGCCAFQNTPWQIHRHPISGSSSTTRLFGKGFRGAKNKQATLAQKLEEAQKQNNQNSGSDDNAEKMEEPTEQEEEDAHAEFARLLAKNPPKKPPKESSSKASSSLFNLQPKKPKTNASNKSAAAAASRKSKKARQDTKAEQDEQEEEDPIRRVGDKAQRRDFEHLLDPVTNHPLGPVRAAQLVPWVPPFLTDYLVIVADPRPLSQTNDWKLAVQYLHSQQQQFNDNDKTTTFLAICASDSPKEVLAWKQQRLQDAQDDSSGNSNNNNQFTILMDSPSLDWMTTYGCVGDTVIAPGNIQNPWSLHILIVDNDGIIRFHEGGVDPSKACPMVRDAISSSFPP